MKLTDVIASVNRTDAYPTVITDEEFTVTFFNDAAKDIFKGMENGRPFGDFAEIYNQKELLRSRYPSSALIKVGGERLLCAFCPVTMGFQRECVFTIAAPKKEGNSDGEYYLSMKTAVLLKCMGELNGEGLPSKAKQTYTKLYDRYQANMRLITALAGNVVSAAVNVKELLCTVFSYYCFLKYGGEDRKRYGVFTNEDIMMMNNVLCVVIVTAFDLCEKLAQNGYCGVTVNEDREEKKTSVTFEFRPKNKLISAMRKTDDAEDAIYYVLGREAEDLYLINSLTERINGCVDIKYDDAVETITVTVPAEKGNYLRAFGADLLTASRIAAERATAK